MVIRVAMIADYPDSGQQVDGGVQAVTKYLVDALALMPEIDLHILSFRAGIRNTTVTKEHGFTRHVIPHSKLGVLTGFRNDQSNLDKSLSEIDPDIVHCQGGGHQGILASRTPYPTVITIHGILTQEIKYLPRINQRVRARLQVWMGERHYIRRAKHTILISPYVADYYGDALAGKHYLIPNPVDARFFKVDRRDSSGRVLFLGRLRALKGVKDLLNAVSELPSKSGLRVILGGSLADQSYVSELKSIVSRERLSDIVEFRGILDSEQILEELSRCACLVLPSYQETAPMVIQEAMACGAPVIASNICGIPHQVINGKTGFLFPSGRSDVLAGKLAELLADQGLRERFSRAARERAEKEYRATEIARKTVNVYEDVLG